MDNARVADGGVSLIFVYGTLKHGFYNHSLISDLKHTGDAAFIGSRATLDAFPLVCGPNGIPYLINLPGLGHRIRGELYSVSSSRGLARLDELEGVDRAHYERLRVAVVADGGDEVEHAEAYFAHRGFGEAMRKRCGEEGLMSEYTLEMGRKYVRREDSVNVESEGASTFNVDLNAWFSAAISCGGKNKDGKFIISGSIRLFQPFERIELAQPSNPMCVTCFTSVGGLLLYLPHLKEKASNFGIHVNHNEQEAKSCTSPNFPSIRNDLLAKLQSCSICRGRNNSTRFNL